MELLGIKEKSTKLEVLQELLTELKGKKIIIFSEFAKMCEILKREIPGSLMIIGDTPQDKRVDILKEFTEDQDKQVLILSSAGMYGLNIQIGEAIIHYDMPFSISRLIQREGRAHRIGQQGTVLVYRLLAKGTVDNHVARILHGKQDVATEMLGDPKFTISDIREILSNNDI